MSWIKDAIISGMESNDAANIQGLPYRESMLSANSPRPILNIPVLMVLKFDSILKRLHVSRLSVA